MTAVAALEAYGAELVGKTIHLTPFGEAAGGEAKVIMLCPDFNVPEIVLLVRHPIFGEIGIFDFEEIQL